MIILIVFNFNLEVKIKYCRLNNLDKEKNGVDI